MHLRTGCFVVLALTVNFLRAEDDARPIVRKAVQADNRNEEIRRNYTYRVYEVTRDLNKDGILKVTHSSLTEVLYVGGQPYLHTIEKDGKPLSAGEARKAQAQLDKAVKEADRMSDEERKARAEKARRARAKSRDQLRFVPDAFEFHMVGESEVAGRPAWQIKAAPLRDYRGPYAFLLRNMEGTLWIDKQDYQWVKVDADALGTISFGWFLARIGKGTRMSFENMRVNDEIWAPKTISLRAKARVALLKGFNTEQELEFRDYRKFHTDSRIVATEEPAK